MAGELQPLDQQFAIVDGQGRPTLYFTKWAQQRQIDIGDSITLADLATYLAAHKLIAGTGIQFAPDGNLANSPTIHADVQAILDEITATRGAMLYRGLLGWAALLPGTAGLFLQTAGAGADPLWAAAGGGSTPWYINTPLAATFTKASGDATQLVLTDSADVGLIVNCGAPVAGQIARIAYKTLSNKALDWEVTVRLLCAAPNVANTGLSVYLMDSVGGRLVSYDLLRETNISGVFYWGSLASFTSNPFSYTPMRPIEWVRITATGAFLSFQISESGKQWVEVFNVGITVHLANRPDRIGFGSNTNRAANFRNMLTANYFTLTGPAV